MAVRVTVDRGLAWVTFGTGERGNAMTRAVRAALHRELDRLEKDSSVRALVLEGAGAHFCAGADLRAHHEALLSDPESVAGSTRREFSPIIARLASFPAPVVSCLRGAVAGAGLGMALAADLRIADPTTRFSTAFARVGLGPDSGVSHFLPRLIGHGRAMDLLLRPRPVAAGEALELGLVTEVVADSHSRCREVGAALAAGPTFAYRAIKSTLEAGRQGLGPALGAEADWQERAALTHDHRAGVSAFLAKAAPDFQGR